MQIRFKIREVHLKIYWVNRIRGKIAQPIPDTESISDFSNFKITSHGIFIKFCGGILWYKNILINL